jgi:hypothetical protein
MLRLTARRLLPFAPALLVAWAAMPGCASKKPTAVVVAVTSETAIPKEIDGFDIEVQRGDSTPLFQTYTLPSDAHLPGTVVLQNRDGESASDPMTVIITARLGSKTRVLRRATLGFVDEKTKLLKMPLRYSCIDFPSECPTGQSCQGGTCAPDAVDVATLPDFSDELVFGRQGASTTCFDDRTTKCLAAAVDVAPATLGTGCTFPFSAVGSGGSASDPGTPGGAGAGGGNPSVPTPPPDAGAGLLGAGTSPQINVAVHWKSAVDPQRLTVLDRDDREGWSFTSTNDGVVLAPGLCQAVASGAITRIVYSTACAPKGPSQPVCESTTQDTGGAGGAGGSGGAGGAAGKVGSGGAAPVDAGSDGGTMGNAGGPTAPDGGTAGAGGGTAPSMCSIAQAQTCGQQASACLGVAFACSGDSTCVSCLMTGSAAAGCSTNSAYQMVVACACSNKAAPACAACCQP